MTVDRQLRMAGITQLAAVVAANRDTATGIRQALDLLQERLACTAVGVWVVEESGRVLRGFATSTGGHAVPDIVTQQDSVLVAAVRKGRAVSVTGGQWPAGDGVFGAAGYVTALFMPLLWGGQARGVLGLFDRAAERNFDTAMPAVQTIAPLLAAALAQPVQDAAEMRALLQAERDRLLHLQVATRQMLEQTNMDANLHAAVEAIQALGWQRVRLALFEEGNGHVDKLFAAGLDREGQQTHTSMIVPGGTWQRLVNGELERHRDTGLYCLYIGDPHNPTWQAGDMLLAVLQVGQGDIVGLIRLDEPVSGLRPTPEALRPVDILANQIAYIVENARLIRRVSETADALSEQVEELSMMHRADRELSTHLNVERVMRLTMDWALRRTNAITGLVMVMTQDRRGLVPSVIMGEIDRTSFVYDEQNPYPVMDGVIGATARTGQTQVVRDVHEKPGTGAFFPRARTYIAVPLSMRGEVLGVIVLASDRADAFGEADVSFLERLARRAAVAFDNARLYRQSEQLADDMAVIYTASRAITSTLEHDEILRRIAQAMAVALECSSTVIFDYVRENSEVQVLSVYRLGTANNASEQLPDVKTTLPLDAFPSLRMAVEQQHPLVLRADDPALSPADRQYLLENQMYAMVLIPLVAQDELIGLAAVVEGRHDRQFTSNDVFKVETLASQAAIALRQSMLYNEVLGLEKLKSEMIRMASHDLRNPLNNIMGYIELLAMEIGESEPAPDVMMHLEQLRRGTRAMQSLLEDLLTLERIESDRLGEWELFDLRGLAAEVVEEQQGSAARKHHTLALEYPDLPMQLHGSITQMRQAIANLVGNAIKYTPEHGQIEVELKGQGKRLHFEVRDNGYGISPERQARVFERFYRAQEPGTEHIGGTGLGLSLVKTVIERHGGAVWFESAPGAGSTFGFWVPAATEE